MSLPELYASPTLRVLANVADPARLEAEGYELVTFEPLWRNRQNRPFGDRFAAKYRLNALHIVPVDNSWYQYPDMEDCLAAVARVTGPDVAAMGASMGAYGSVTLSDRFRATRSVAFAPQFSIRRDLVPFETRWAPEAARIAFQPWDGSVAKGCRHYIIYEPGTRDAEHARLIMAQGADVVPVEVPAGGHTVSRVLVEAGALSRIVLRVLAGTPTAEDLLAEIAPKLERSPEWHMNRAAAGPPEEREAHLRAGLAINRKHLWLNYALGAFLAGERRYEEALPHLAFVAIRRPAIPKVARLYLAVCAKTGTVPHPTVPAAAASLPKPDARPPSA
ncbi:hypothetical protein DFH01_04355 [Falsiroseomonas bella]|uniref:Alpha/beta hydrolase n=1 Tax=Falsiroseomonas bella TaxID=2184016 RepID=A0A317FLT1_9PROT|nr:hypothetical protein [Falsiroseomonas bella]PWS38518.1 hypothetical protein DFH01_04355 [Falsiroseomonas bella]